MKITRHTTKVTLELDTKVDYTYNPGCLAYLSGPPEACYPEEPPEVELERVTLQFKIPFHLPDGTLIHKPIEVDILDFISDQQSNNLIKQLLENHD